MSGRSQTEIQIRRARPDEAGELTALSMRSKQSNGYDDAFMDACRRELTVTEQWFEEAEIWVADSGVVCGMVCLSIDPDGRSGEVLSFFIDPEWQRKGIGRLLWQKLFERSAIMKVHSLQLDADPFAVPFYEAMGFRVVGKAASGSIEGRFLPHMKIQLAGKNLVVKSINLDGECLCVDIFQRPDGTFGFGEYRRDPEDGRGWFAVGSFSEQSFESEADALAEAQKQVAWLAGVIEDQ